MNPSQIDTGKGTRASDGAVRFSRSGSTGRRRKAPIYEFKFEEGDALGGDLTITERLSAGPFTEIYRVWSEERMCTLVCKQLRSDLTDEREHKRMLAVERRVLRAVRHPNVVRPYGSSATLETDHVLIESLPGPSLLELMTAAPRRRLKPTTALRIAVGIGSALHAVHEAGYLYRDVKPANIIMRDDTPVLVDFGACYRRHRGRTPRGRVGTDPYMAPEQCLSRHLSPRTDVFGLGAVTYELLTGEWPFEDQLMNVFDRSKLENRFPQVAHSPGTVLRRLPAVGAAVEEVIHRCLATDPQDRYATAAEAVAELNGLLDREEQVFPAARDRNRAA